VKAQIITEPRARLPKETHCHAVMLSEGACPSRNTPTQLHPPICPWEFPHPEPGAPYLPASSSHQLLTILCRGQMWGSLRPVQAPDFSPGTPPFLVCHPEGALVEPARQSANRGTSCFESGGGCPGCPTPPCVGKWKAPQLFGRGHGQSSTLPLKPKPGLPRLHLFSAVIVEGHVTTSKSSQ
jgi:hypothetical protein